MTTPRIRVGISACLLGEKVRYDGGHKLDESLRDTLGQSVEWVPVCPEFELGLGVPRETLRLEGDPARPRLVFSTTRVDITEQMHAWCARRGEELAPLGLRGYVFKGRSPSCALNTAEVWIRPDEHGARGYGLWAQAFRERFPDLVVAEAESLATPQARADFARRLGLALGEPA